METYTGMASAPRFHISTLPRRQSSRFVWRFVFRAALSVRLGESRGRDLASCDLGTRFAVAPVCGWARAKRGQSEWYVRKESSTTLPSSVCVAVSGSCHQKSRDLGRFCTVMSVLGRVGGGGFCHSEGKGVNRSSTVAIVFCMGGFNPYRPRVFISFSKITFSAQS